MDFLIGNQIGQLTMKILTEGLDSVPPAVVESTLTELTAIEELIRASPHHLDKKPGALELMQIMRELLEGKNEPFDGLHQMIECIRHMVTGSKRRFTYADTTH